MPRPTDPLSRLLEELKRRRVFRVTAAYVVAAFVVLQGADLVFPALLLPEWSLRLLVVAAIAGLPVAVGLGWAFDLTTEGVVRTDDAARLGIGRRLGLMAVVVLTLAGGGWWVARGAGRDGPPTAGADAPAPAAGPRSIAVLPFASMGAAEPDYFADGIHEDVLTQLALVGDLAVISRTSVILYRGSALSVPEIAGELGVAYVLEGSVRRDGGRVRIVAQLIDADTDRHLWAETFDRDIADIFAVQSEVAQRIAASLEARISQMERERVERRPTENMAAYDLFLRARELRARSREENDTGIELLKQAIRMDPAFADAHALLGRLFMYRVQEFGYPVEWADSGITAARRAIEIEPDLPSALTSLGANLYHLGRHGEAEGAVRHALEVSPGDIDAMIVLAVLTNARGRFDEAYRQLLRANRIDPKNSYVALNLADNATSVGEPEAALSWLDEARMRGFPNPAFVDLLRARALAAAGGVDEAWRLADSLATARPAEPMAIAAAALIASATSRHSEAFARLETLYGLAPDAFDGRIRIPLRYAGALLRSGEAERAQVLFDDVLAAARARQAAGDESYAPALNIAAVLAYRGQREEAYEWLERAWAAGFRDRLDLETDPAWTGMRGEARFQRFETRLRAEMEAMRRRIRPKGVELPS